MESINTFVLVFCVTAIMVGGIRLLLGGVLESSGKYILAIVLLTVTVSAITNINVSFKVNRKETETKINDYSQNLIAYETQYVVEKLFEENNIGFKKIVVKTNKNKDGDIVISEVVVYDAKEKDKAKNLIVSNQIASKVTFK